MEKKTDKRKQKRVKKIFFVGYRKTDEEHFNVSYAKDISSGGLRFDTGCQFKKDEKITLSVRFPYEDKNIMLTASVVESKETLKQDKYDTRVLFIDVKDCDKKIIDKAVKFYS